MAENKGNGVSVVKYGLRSCGMFFGILIVGFILFGVFRYWLGPMLTATSTCWGIETCLYSVSIGDSSVRRVRFSPDGSTLAIIGNDEVIVDAENGDRISNFTDSSDAVADLVFSQDSQYFAYKNKDNLTIHTIDGEDFSEFPFEGRCDFLRPDCIAFVADREMIAMTGVEDGFDIYFMNGQFVTHFPTENRINGIVVSPDSQTIALAEAGGRIYLHQVSDLANEVQIGGHDGDVRIMQFSGDNQRLISVGDDDDQTRVWDVATGELLQVLPAVGNPTDMSVDGSGKLVAISEDNGLVTLWDIEAAEIVQEWTFGRSVRTVSLSPDGSKLALGLAREVTMVDDRIYTQRRPGELYRRTGPSFSVQGESVSAGSALVLETGLE